MYNILILGCVHRYNTNLRNSSVSLVNNAVVFKYVHVIKIYLKRYVICSLIKTQNKTAPHKKKQTSKQANNEAAWPSCQRVGLAIRRSRVRVPLWPLAGFVLGRPEFKFSTTLVNSQLVAFCLLGFLILLCCI